MKAGMTVVAALFAVGVVPALPASGQEGDPVQELFELSAPAPAEPLQGRGRAGMGRGQSTVGLKVEHWEPELEVTGVDTGNQPDSDWEMEVIHAGGMATFNYEGSASAKGKFNLHGGIGFERLVVTLEHDPSSSEGFVRMDDSLVFEFGGGYTFLLDSADVKVVGSGRIGNAEWEDPSTGGDTWTYEYTLFRFGAEVGLRSTPGVRPFLGLRYSLYESELTQEMFGGGPDDFWEGEYDQPFGVSVGVDLEGQSVAARMELLFVDDTAVGFLASAGYSF